MTEDLDTQIRRAEMTVVESDRRLLQTARQLATASRGAAQRAAWIGGGSLAVIASTWLVVRALSRPAPPPHEWPARKAPNGPPPTARETASGARLAPPLPDGTRRGPDGFGPALGLGPGGAQDRRRRAARLRDGMALVQPAPRLAPLTAGRLRV